MISRSPGSETPSRSPDLLERLALLLLPRPRVARAQRARERTPRHEEEEQHQLDALQQREEEHGEAGRPALPHGARERLADDEREHGERRAPPPERGRLVAQGEPQPRAAECRERRRRRARGLQEPLRFVEVALGQRGAAEPSLDPRAQPEAAHAAHRLRREREHGDAGDDDEHEPERHDVGSPSARRK